jgi:hypothetical protein
MEAQMEGELVEGKKKKSQRMKTFWEAVLAAQRR